MTTAASDDNRGPYRKNNLTPEGGVLQADGLVILNYGKDPHARVALAAYADACQATHPVRAIDLRAALAKLRMTRIPTEHQPANPDVWRARFAGHIEGGIAAAGLTGDDLVTAQGFDRELTRAFTVYLNSTDADRRRHFLMQINAIGARAYAFYVQLDRPELRVPIESILFDLGGLADVLTHSGT
ncbi:hypothetical protein EB73_29195 [Mycobacterium sp. SWH-M3]|nr:hypothetical protein EB73_29195 [Mycobacterium sp. SWH-M3]